MLNIALNSSKFSDLARHGFLSTYKITTIHSLRLKLSRLSYFNEHSTWVIKIIQENAPYKTFTTRINHTDETFF